MKTKTEYKNVYLENTKIKTKGFNGLYRYKITIKGLKLCSASTVFKTAKDCAIALDKKLIENGFQPINILKKANGI